MILMQRSTISKITGIQNLRYEELVVLEFGQVQQRGEDIGLGPAQHVNSNKLEQWISDLQQRAIWIAIVLEAFNMVHVYSM